MQREGSKLVQHQNVLYKNWKAVPFIFRGQMNICVCISYSVYSNAQTTPVRIYGEQYAHKFCAVDIFWNITRHQAISPVAKFHHVLGRGFMIMRVILFLSNVSQPFRMNYFTLKYNILKYYPIVLSIHLVDLTNIHCIENSLIGFQYTPFY